MNYLVTGCAGFEDGLRAEFEWIAAATTPSS
jgi:hypothetical protein